MPTLPGAGRELVPYFSSPKECVNETLSQAKTDAARFVLVARLAGAHVHAPVHDVYNIFASYLQQEKEKVTEEILPTQCKLCSVIT